MGLAVDECWKNEWLLKKNNFILEPGTGHVKVEVQAGLGHCMGREDCPEAEAGGRRWRAALR